MVEMSVKHSKPHTFAIVEEAPPTIFDGAKKETPRRYPLFREETTGKIF